LLSKRIKLDDQAPLLFDHSRAPCLALVTSLQYLGLLYGSQLLLLQRLLRLECRQVQASKWCVSTGA
jgi:hypothetical protein